MIADHDGATDGERLKSHPPDRKYEIVLNQSGWQVRDYVSNARSERINFHSDRRTSGAYGGNVTVAMT
jgi:hypothetical protein